GPTSVAEAGFPLATPAALLDLRPAPARPRRRGCTLPALSRYGFFTAVTRTSACLNGPQGRGSALDVCGFLRARGTPVAPGRGGREERSGAGSFGGLNAFRPRGLRPRRLFDGRISWDNLDGRLVCESALGAEGLASSHGACCSSLLHRPVLG